MTVVAETENSGKPLDKPCRHESDALLMEEKPPIGPVVVLLLAAIAIVAFGLNPLGVLPSQQPALTVVVATPSAATIGNNSRTPMRLSSSGSHGFQANAPLVVPDVVPLPARPPKSFQSASMPAGIFGAVRGDEWQVQTVAFPEVMAPGVEVLHTAAWKPMISWRKSSGGETLLPVARVRCGGLSPQAVARRADKYDLMISQMARKYTVDENLVKAIITRESCFDQAAVSHVGAIGLMQLMPETARWLKVKNPAKAESNLAGGVKYISSLYKEFGTLELALAAYNAGPGNVRRYGGIPPFRETQSYVKTVLGFYRRYTAADHFVSS